MKVDGIENNGQRGPIKTIRFIEAEELSEINGSYQVSTEEPLIENHKCSIENIS
jgi:hypothetical protein